jgi:fructose-1,6-bisphosphatase/inositol monophosphatase family enzyme
VEEAGGRVSDFSGGIFDVRRGAIVAANPRIHGELVAGLNQN